MSDKTTMTVIPAAPGWYVVNFIYDDGATVGAAVIAWLITETISERSGDITTHGAPISLDRIDHTYDNIAVMRPDGVIEAGEEIFSGLFGFDTYIANWSKKVPAA